MNLRPGMYLPGGPLRIWQVGAVCLPFLVVVLVPLRIWAFTNSIPWLIPALGLPFLALLVVVWIAGLVRDLPLWALPALGMVLFFVSALLQVVAQIMVVTLIFYPVFGRWGWPGDLSLAENIWMALLVQLLFLGMMAMVLALLLRIVPQFHARVRQEWTLLSFLLYEISIAPVLIWSDEFVGVHWYQAASLLALAIGAGLYLVAPRRWQRIVALVFPAALAPVIMALGLYQTFPAQPWANPADASFRLWESLQPLLYHLPVLLLLLLASLAPRVPGSGGRAPASLPAPILPVNGNE